MMNAKETHLASNQKVNTDKMCKALTLLGREINSQKSTESDFGAKTKGTECNDIETKCSGLLKCRSKIRKAQIHKLRENLATACFVVKTVASAKETQSISLHKRLSLVQSEFADLLNEHKKNTEIISNLSKENDKLRHKLNNISNCIQLGYNELLKIRNQPMTEISSLFQLRELILCCGEYYADYCNEHEKFLQTEQRNRFLKNNIMNLEIEIDAISGQMRQLLPCKNCLQKGRIKSEHSGVNQKDYSEIKIETSKNTEISNQSINFKNQYNDIMDSVDFKLCNDDYGLDLSSHFLLVKKLLHHQDTLHKDLKLMSREFSGLL